jgi:hypothetical protein
MSELAAGLDPSAYLAFSARLASGVGDPRQLKAQADSLLGACQAGDLTLLVRHSASLAASAQMAAHKALQNALQCDDDPAQFRRWMKASEDAQVLASKAGKELAALTDRQRLLEPYRTQVSGALAEYAISQAKAILIAGDPIAAWTPTLIESDIEP